MPANLGARIALGWRIAPILTAAMVILTVTFITTITLLDISRARQIYRDELRNRGELLSGQMNVLLADPLYVRNVEDIEKTAAIVGSQPDVEYVQVFSPDGAMLADSTLTGFLSLGASADELGQRALAERLSIKETNAGVLEIARPVTIGDQVVGGVQIGLRSDVLEAQVDAIIAEHIRQGLLLTIIAAGLAYFIARQFSRPVTSLVHATNSMAAGNLDTRVHDVRAGELRELAASFNTMAQELHATIADLRDSRGRIVGVQEGVRREIATNLHGQVQARLLVLRTELYRMMQASDTAPETARQLTGVVEQLDDLVHSEISTLSRRLYPSILRRGLVPALESLADQFDTSFEITLDISARFERMEQFQRDLLPEPVKLAGYRVAEDALTNVLKHADAAKVTIRLDMPDGGSLRLLIEDDGSGFDVDGSSRGLGLEAMRDYAGAVGGSFEIRSAPGHGSVVTTLLPLAGPHPTALPDATVAARGHAIVAAPEIPPER